MRSKWRAHERLRTSNVSHSDPPADPFVHERAAGPSRFGAGPDVWGFRRGESHIRIYPTLALKLAGTCNRSR